MHLLEYLNDYFGMNLLEDLKLQWTIFDFYDEDRMSESSIEVQEEDKFTSDL